MAPRAETRWLSVILAACLAVAVATIARRASQMSCASLARAITRWGDAGAGFGDEGQLRRCSRAGIIGVVTQSGAGGPA
jgi:hypothetical protein